MTQVYPGLPPENNSPQPRSPKDRSWILKLDA